MSSFIGQRGEQKKLNSISVLTLKRNGTVTGIIEHHFCKSSLKTVCLRVSFPEMKKVPPSLLLLVS